MLLTRWLDSFAGHIFDSKKRKFVLAHRGVEQGTSLTAAMWSRNVGGQLEQLEARALLAVYDFGDAPDTSLGTGIGDYQTLLDDSGPSHVIDDSQATLFLGASVDGEGDGSPNTTANGDDIATLLAPDDEDGLIEPARDLVLTVGTAPVVRVRATNLTGSVATLYGWIDFNRDGVFDNHSERTSVSVAASTDNGTFRLMFPTIPVGTEAGASYARFRLSTDPAAASSTGEAMDGEVEDYAATIIQPSITPLSASPADSKSYVKIASGINGLPVIPNHDAFGYETDPVASLGDLDGDGVNDMAVGVTHDDTGGYNRGAVHVLLMNANGTVKSSVKIASGTNGGPTLANKDFFGTSIASLGDLDGDGVTDLAVGAQGDNTYRGAVHVLLMNAGGTVKSSVKIASGTNGGPTLAPVDVFGSSVAALGDLNGDGVTDLAVGARLDDIYNRGAVYVLLMNASGTVQSSKKIASGLTGGPALENNAFFGRSLASLGDLDGDGVTDLAVGGKKDSLINGSGGGLYVLMMKADGTVKSSVHIASNLNGGPTLTASDSFGRCLTSLGDLDGNGFTDLAVGSVDKATDDVPRGAVYVLLLGLDMEGEVTVKSSVKIAGSKNGGPTLASRSANFGISVASLGDLDGDGMTDLAVAATGAVYVLFMTPGIDSDSISSSVEDAAPNGGDGNDDGMPDSQQNNVASLSNSDDGPNNNDLKYVTFVTPADNPLRNVSAIGNPTYYDNTAPQLSEFPAGFFSFEVVGLNDGDSTTVTLFSPDVTVDTYYQFGRIPDDPNPNDHWYEFLYDGLTGAQFSEDGRVVTLHFVDGGRGDSDLTANGTIKVTGVPVLDPDGDGVATSVEDAAPNGGDGNNDGMPDSQQNVASLPSNDGHGLAKYVTLASIGDARLRRVSAIENPRQGGPRETDMPPVGYFQFDVDSLTAIGTMVTMLMPPDVTVDTYYQFGPTPDNSSDHWYEFLYDGLTGAQFSEDGHVVTLHFVDGGRGDSDLTENGTIKVIGVPTIALDNDGVSTGVEDDAPNGGDGNNDGTPDSEQNNVTSLPNSYGVQYVTIESPSGTSLGSVAAPENPPAPVPGGVTFPIGFLDFTVTGIAPGTAKDVILYLPDDTVVTSYYKYGPTSEMTTPHWYEFVYDPMSLDLTGAEIDAGVDEEDTEPERIILHFVDGQRGDDDLTVNGKIEDPGAPALSYDFGDAPSPYPVTLADDGARHAATGPMLGINRDSEADGVNSTNAAADDSTGALDDEDGVTFLTTILASASGATTASVEIDLQNANATANQLDAWLDLNRDGDWDDADEQILANYDLGTSNGVQVVSFTIPQDVGANVDLGTTYARFRLSTTGGLLPTEGANNGEVEDYQVNILQSPPDIVMNSVTANGKTMLTVQYQILNSNAAGPLSLRFLQSTDALASGADPVLSTVAINNAADLTVGTHTLNFAIGSQVLLPGAGKPEVATDYFILAVADPANAIIETDSDPLNEDNTVAFVGAYATSTTIYMHGGAADDTVTLTYPATKLGNATLGLSGSLSATYTYAYAYYSTAQFRLRTHGGHDTVNVVNSANLNARPMFELGGDGDDVLNGATGADTLNGGAGNDTLSGSTGGDALNGGLGTNMLRESGNFNFTLTNTRLNGVGTGTDTLANLQVVNLTGGGGANTFTVSGWTGGGALDGFGGNDRIVAVRNTDMTLTNSSLAAIGFDTLTLSSIETANLSGGAAANKLIANQFTLGSVTLQGGDGADVLIGGSQKDRLIGGAGRDLLIGGAGADTLHGGSLDDILIGGTSSHSSDIAALNAIMAEWTSANSYATRVANLLNGGGANGTTVLNATSVQDDSAADRLTGDSSIDWFFQSAGDVLVDFNAYAGELKTAI